MKREDIVAELRTLGKLFQKGRMTEEAYHESRQELEALLASLEAAPSDGSRTLRQYLSKGRLPLLESLRLLYTITEALTLSHAKESAQLDLTPEGIILLDPPPYTIRIVEEEAPAESALSGPKTERTSAFTDDESDIPLDDTDPLQSTLQIEGFHLFEQEYGSEISKASEIYALGLLLYEMVAGSVPIIGSLPLLEEARALQTDGRLPLFECNDAIEVVYFEQIAVLNELYLACTHKRFGERPSLLSLQHRLISCYHALFAARQEAIQAREARLEQLLLRGRMEEVQAFVEESHALFPEHVRWLNLLPRLAHDSECLNSLAESLQERFSSEPLEAILFSWFSIEPQIEAKGPYLRHPFHRMLRERQIQMHDALARAEELFLSDPASALDLLQKPPIPALFWSVRRLELLDQNLQNEESRRSAEEQAEAQRRAEIQRVADLQRLAPPGFLWIEPGRFMMGSPDDDSEAYGDEKPPIRMTIARGFWIKQTPVTQAEWQAVMSFQPSFFRNLPTHPVEQISWYEAVWFCNQLSSLNDLPPAYHFEQIQAEPGHRDFSIGLVEWERESIGFRLPTEAEWEYACRAATTAPRYGVLDEIAWHFGNSVKKTHPVGTKQPNAWGLHDMIGNVWEWCYDIYKKDLGSSDLIEGQTSEKGKAPPKRVMRGGSWGNSGASLRAATRNRDNPAHRKHDLGFRILRFR